MVDFKVYMKAFLLDPDILNDLVYCQKSLFTTIKIHQDLVEEHLSIGSDPPNYNQVRTMLDELEEIIESINSDQLKVTSMLKTELGMFFELIKSTSLNVVDIDFNAAHEYITQTIQDHFYYGSENDIVPKYIEMHLTEQELEDKFVTPLKSLITVGTKRKTQLSLLKSKQERVKVQPKAPRKSLHIIAEPVSTIPVEKKNKVQETKNVKEIKKDEIIKEVKKEKDEELPQPTTNISNSRMNLLKALTKAKTNLTTIATFEHLDDSPEWPSSCEENENNQEQEEEEVDGVLYEEMPIALEPVRKPIGRPPKKRSNSSSSSSKSRKSPENNDEGSSDSWKGKFPPIDPLQDGEDEEMEMKDYDQEGFLRIFGLITPEQKEAIQQRRNERKKRKVTRKNNEKKDFFYGNIDIYESERQYRRMTNRKPQLYSPQPQLIKPQSIMKPQLIMKPIREDPLAQNPVKSAKRKIFSSAPGIRKCNTCAKASNKMLVCIQCTEYFHLTCHNNTYDLNLDVELKTTCPACFG